MFDIAWGEFLIIAVVALIVIGPKELPAVLRTIGHWTAKIRRMAAEFQGQFQEALREAEMADLRKEVDQLNDKIGEETRNLASYDPMSFQSAAEAERRREAEAEEALRLADAAASSDAPAPVAADASSDSPDARNADGHGANEAPAAEPLAIEQPVTSEVAALPNPAAPVTAPSAASLSSSDSSGDPKGGGEGVHT